MGEERSRTAPAYLSADRAPSEVTYTLTQQQRRRWRRRGRAVGPYQPSQSRSIDSFSPAGGLEHQSSFLLAQAGKSQTGKAVSSRTSQEPGLLGPVPKDEALGSQHGEEEGLPAFPRDCKEQRRGSGQLSSPRFFPTLCHREPRRVGVVGAGQQDFLGCGPFPRSF